MALFFDELPKARRSAVHLEMRDAYMVDDPSFIAWQRGEHADPVEHWREWVDLISATVARGVEVRRARIVSEPVSEYILWEHEVTAMNVAASEQVRWLPRRQATSLALPGNDYWLFDEETVLVNHFDGNGQPSKPAEELIRDPDVAKLCASAFEAVWQRAVPHEDYHP